MKSQPIKFQRSVNLKTKSYPVYIGSNSTTKLSPLLTTHGIENRIIIITDDIVEGLYGNRLLEQLSADHYEVSIYSFPNGERSKFSITVEQIYSWMLENNCKRDVTIIALGGGVVGDIAGFVAATFMRGVRYVQIPTTLLAQVDSSVGGKVGINHELSKNVIGAFYHPLFVLIDPAVLSTLNQREITCGLGEVIKYGLIKDIDLFVELEAHLYDLYESDNQRWIEKIIYQCCSIKADIVEQDEQESGIRRILNFGHTIGHALEAATGYDYLNHGESILYGMLSASYVAHRLNYLQRHEFERILRVLALIDKPPLPDDLTEDMLMQRVRHDKKQQESGLHFVLLDRIGHAKIELVSDQLVRSGIAHLLHS
ncbi:3-dehydroquinate synthase [candidate division KSB1 bacterium]|nr:3-dehydroquinate synthase [candidate division KSB1 bacterium]